MGAAAGGPVVAAAGMRRLEAATALVVTDGAGGGGGRRRTGGAGGWCLGRRDGDDGGCILGDFNGKQKMGEERIWGKWMEARKVTGEWIRNGACREKNSPGCRALLCLFRGPTQGCSAGDPIF